MRFHPTEEVVLLDQNFQPHKLVEIVSFDVTLAQYRIKYYYSTNECELIKVPVTRLVEKTEHFTKLLRDAAARN